MADSMSDISPEKKTVKAEIDHSAERHRHQLQVINHTLHQNPELAWEETIAHDTICAFLSELDIKVTPGAYGVKTAFEARSESNDSRGRCVNFNAEYDALPGIGHGCGHNLIAIASLTGFLALSSAVKRFGIPGKVQLLGTPAEEAGGGKITLLDAGAYDGVDVSLMGHPFGNTNHGDSKSNTGSAGQRSIAHLGLFCEFHGKNAHASANPWDGINALDALVLAYNNISALRQQMQPSERVHGCILEAPKVTNVIPDFTKVSYSVRSPTMEGARKLGQKVKNCFEAAGLATGCKVQISEESMYADLRVNETLCDRYTSHMLEYGEHVCKIRDDPMSGSTDQGNISYAIPALHSIFGIPGPGHIHPHDAEFARAAGTNEAFECALRAGKAMALTGWDILTDDGVHQQCIKDFEEDKKFRGC